MTPNKCTVISSACVIVLSALTAATAAASAAAGTGGRAAAPAPEVMTSRPYQGLDHPLARSGAAPGVPLPGWWKGSAPGALRGSAWRLATEQPVSQEDGQWRREGTPNGAAPSGGLLSASCTGSACTAVGWYANHAGDELTLAERRLHGRWRVQRTGNPASAIWSVLFGVSCTARACTAVGYYINHAGRDLPLAEHWNGKRWRIEPTPQPPGTAATGFFAVSCVSGTACTAVGTYDNQAGRSLALVESWNGSRWKIRAAAYHRGSTSLSGVSCTSPGACVAVGSFTGAGAGGPVAERWNGRRWRNQAVPSTGGGLAGVSCPSARTCIAVGMSGGSGPLAEQWNGRRWKVLATPRPSTAFDELLSVSCTSARACTAAGGFAQRYGNEAALAERWNGRKWKIERPLSPWRLGSVLTAVSCGSGRACTATGVYVGGCCAFNLELAEGWNGASWHVQPVIRPAGASDTQLSGVSCTSARACTAVGYNQAYGPLAESWNGVRWRLQFAPIPTGTRFAVFEGVSCASATACVAVGYADAPRLDVPMAERWNGTGWIVQKLPPLNESDGGETLLQAVSCSSAIACTAVGSYSSSSGAELPLVERWNGTSWTMQDVPVTGGGFAGLSGVSCSSATACILVGGVNNGDPDGPVALADSWNGTTWTAQALPPGTPFLNSVSCASASACTAVGHSDAGPAAAVGWNGITWSAQSIPTPPDDRFAYLNGVWCTSAVACTAVGDGAPGISYTDHMFADQWNGVSWQLQLIPHPADALNPGLAAVACTAATACTAVGSYLSISGIYVTLAETTAAR